MSTSFVTLNPDDLSNQERYKLIIGSVLPRPIAFVSTLSAEGQMNLAPFSFFNAVCSSPPTLLFCPMRRGNDGGKKDTLINIDETGEFVVNVVSEAIVAQMNLTAGEFPPDVNEFLESDLTPAPSVIVRPPRVKESPVSMECKLQQIIPVGGGGVGSGAVVLGTIVQFHVREDLLEEGRVNTTLLQPVARLAGSAYCPVREVFEIQRPG